MKSTKFKKAAHSLTEMVVIIGIVALLAALTLPAYKNYVIQARVSSALDYLNILKDTLLQQRAEFIPAGTFTFGGADRTHNTKFQVAPDDSIWGEYYYWGPGTYNGIEMVCVLVNGLQGIDGYNEFTVSGGAVTANGTKNRICVRTYSNEEIFNHDCGRFADETRDIPLEYLPVGCQCSSLSTAELGSC